MARIDLSDVIQESNSLDNKVLDQVYTEIRNNVINEEGSANLLSASIKGDNTADDKLRKIISDIIDNKEYSVQGMNKQELLDYMCYNIYGLGPAQKYLFDKDVTDIVVNGYGPNEPIRYDKNGLTYISNDYYKDAQQLLNTIGRMLYPLGKAVNEGKPTEESTLPDGSRLTVAISPISIHGPSFSIRRHSDEVFTPEDYQRLGTGNEEMFKLLKYLTRGGANILVCGVTSAGKTSLLRAISTYLGNDMRIITIEDTEELQLKKHMPDRNILALLAQSGRVNFSVGDCLVLTLRQRPDTIVIGEVREKETKDLINAMKTGHQVLGTIHAQTVEQAIERIKDEISAVDPNRSDTVLHREITRAVDIVVQINFFKHSGQRIITGISETIGYEDGKIIYNDIYKYRNKKFIRESTLSKELSLKLLGNGVVDLLNTPWVSDELTEEERDAFA